MLQQQDAKEGQMTRKSRQDFKRSKSRMRCDLFSEDIG